MARNTKPRKPYRPKYKPDVNPIELAILRAAALTPAEVEITMQPIAPALQALREGRASHDDWDNLQGMTTAALAIEAKGIVKGLRSVMQAAHDALANIYDRSQLHDGWRPTALYAPELAAITEAVRLHRWQLAQLSGGEYHAAIRRAVGQVQQQGGKVIHV